MQPLQVAQSAGQLLWLWQSAEVSMAWWLRPWVLEWSLFSVPVLGHAVQEDGLVRFIGWRTVWGLVSDM